MKTIKDVIKFLKECRNTHIFYYKHPKYCRGNIGSSKFHKEVYNQYQEAINILKYTKEK